MSIFNMIAQGSGGGGGGGNVGEPTNLFVSTVGLDATIKWTDNNLNSIPPTTFAKSELVRKIGSAPATPSDGTIVVTETVMNTYQSVGYVDTGLTDGATYYYKVFSYSTDGAISYCNAVSATPTSGGWQPGANTIGYYPMNRDILNHATTGSTFPDGILNTATFSTAQVHGNNTYSLYCDGSTYAYLPASSEFEFGTNDFTISCWVYSETNSGTHTGIISNYKDTISISNLNQGWRLSDRFGNNNQLNRCWNAGTLGEGAIWVDGKTNISIKDGWHNIVLTRTNGTLRLYLDGDTTPKWTNSSYPTKNVGRNSRMAFGVNMADGYYSTCYLNDVIFENVGWSAQEVSDYYTQTS